MIQFIHTADIHFGMENYGRPDAQTGIHSRLLDFERALQFCIDFACEKKVDFFLFCGDAYKTAHPSPTQQRLLLNCLLRLYKAQIPVIIIVGNHDSSFSFGKAHALDVFGQLPMDGFYVVSKPTVITLKTKNGPVNIVGIPWPSRANIALHKDFSQGTASQMTQAISEAVGLLIQNFAQALDVTLPAVLAGHLTVGSGIFSGSEKRAVYGTDPLFLPSQLAIAPFDYVALGHLHRHQDLNLHGYPPVVYSGSIERVDFGERKEEKGFCYVTIHEKGKTTYEFVKTPTRSFIQIEVTLDIQRQDHTEQLLTEIARHDLTNAVVKVVYHVPAGCKDRVDVIVIQKACSIAHYLVGIFPIREPEPRPRRASLKVDMDIRTVLTSYFDAKPELKTKRDYLVQKTLELAEEVEKEKE